MEVEQFSLKEPEWILDRKDSGPLFWRRDSSQRSRVKFRYEVDVKEFQRSEHEFEDQFWSEPVSTVMSTSMSVMICLTVTVLLPWFLFAEKGF